MVAHSLHAEYGCPVWRHHEVSSLDRMCLQRWANVGYQGLRHITPHVSIAAKVLADSLPTATTPSMSPEMMLPLQLDDKTDKTPQPDGIKSDQSTKFATWQWPDEPFSNEFTITAAEQQRDAVLSGIINKIGSATVKLQDGHNTLPVSYTHLTLPTSDLV